ncbi:hypothetical protein DFJ73DRAFT_310227, partial [Zopfochytrium polystomum]
DERSINRASENGHTAVLDWWKNSGLVFRYTAAAISGAVKTGRVNMLQWWADSGMKLELPPLL